MARRLVPDPDHQPAGGSGPVEARRLALSRPRNPRPHCQRCQPGRFPRRFTQPWHYSAAQAADIRMTKTIARAYAAEGILAFAVAPGFTVSEMTEEYLQGRGGAAIVADIPLGRVTSTDEVAEAIRWLATEAPAASTGSVVDLNGASYVR